MADWTSRPDAVVIFSLFCAPTALAGLMGCTEVEAAETLLAVPGMPSPTTMGGVSTRRWGKWLETELGLVHRFTQRSDEERRRLSYGQSGKSFYSATVRWPTMSQWLRANPRAEGIALVAGHTLYFKDGEVAADTATTKSMRARVRCVYLTPDSII